MEHGQIDLDGNVVVWREETKEDIAERRVIDLGGRNPLAKEETIEENDKGSD